MAGSACTITEERHGTMKRIGFAWTSDDTTGAVTGTTTYAYSGLIEAVEFVPNTAGTQPSDNYDVTLTDEASVDKLGGAGANRSNAATEILRVTLAVGLGAVANDKLTLNVSAAGNSKTGAVYVYIR